MKPNYSVDVQVNGKSVATKKFTAADALAAATTVTLNDAQLAPGANQIRVVKAGDGRVYWSTRAEYYSNESKVVNTGSFKLSTARQYFKLTPQQKDGASFITSIRCPGRCRWATPWRCASPWAATSGST